MRLVAAWVERYGDRKARSFGSVQILAMRNDLLEKRGPATTNRYLSAMRRCWNWGREVGVIDRAAVWPSKVMLKEPRGRVRYLDDAELAALLKAAEAHSTAMYAAVVVSLATGVRQGELLRLKWKDVDFSKLRLSVLESKNDEARTVHLAANAADALRALKKAPVVGASVFLKPDGQPFDKDALEYHWKAVRSQAGLKDFRWHDLRHSCASYLAQSGASLLEIGSVLGHKSPSVTMRYSHLVQGKPVTGHAALDEKLGKRGDAS
jgi:integrase